MIIMYTVNISLPFYVKMAYDRLFEYVTCITMHVVMKKCFSKISTKIWSIVIVGRSWRLVFFELIIGKVSKNCIDIDNRMSRIHRCSLNTMRLYFSLKIIWPIAIILFHHTILNMFSKMCLVDSEFHYSG